MNVDLTRVRRLSRGFGWVDRRIVWDGHLARMNQVEVAVYLVVCVVADRHGISWCSRNTLAMQTKQPVDRIQEALESLATRGLVAVQGRFVQVLDLNSPVPAPGIPTAVAEAATLPVISPAPSASCREPAAVILAQLEPEKREELLTRARSKMAQFLGRREPGQAALEAVAAGLLDEGAI